jgi:hypothetical protein
VISIDDALQRPLGLLAFKSDLQADSALLTVLDGAMALLNKVGKAIERDTPQDRTRAVALLDRAEQHVERGCTTNTVTDNIEQHLDRVRDLIRGYRAQLAGLPDHE